MQTVDIGVSSELAHSASGIKRRARTFYVDAVHGKDTNAGISPATAWRTLARVDRGRYRGADAILLHGRERFHGSILLGVDNLSATSRRKPLRISSYGGGSAMIAAGSQNGIVVIDRAGVRVSNLRVAGRQASCRPATGGIVFLARSAPHMLTSGVTIDRVAVHGFCYGIEVGVENDRTGFDGVRILAVVAHDNGDAGVITWDPARSKYDVRGVLVDHALTFQNDSEGGIVLFGVDHAVVSDSASYANGDGASGAVGIWTFDSEDVMLEHDESFSNLTAGDDGDGFDLDGGVSNSVMQYDYSHDNAGSGFVICACVKGYVNHNDVIRRDISQNDGSSGQPSAIYVGGGQFFNGADVVANTAYSASGSGPLVQIDGADSRYAHVHLLNNLFAASHAKALLDADPDEGSDLTFEGNDWWSTDGRFRVHWGEGQQFAAFTTWRKETHVETIARRQTGRSVKPLLCALGQARTLFPRPLTTLTAFRLRPNSRLIGAGVNLAQFGHLGGSTDFSGGAVRYRGQYDIGAEEWQPRERC